MTDVRLYFTGDYDLPESPDVVIPDVTVVIDRGSDPSDLGCYAVFVHEVDDSDPGQVRETLLRLVPTEIGMGMDCVLRINGRLVGPIAGGVAYGATSDQVVSLLLD